MRRSLAALVLTASLSLTGCNAVKAIVAGSSAAQAAPVSVAQAEKGLVIAHLAYNGLGTALLAAANAHVLHGKDAATAKSYYDKAGDALNLADQADNVANTQGVVSQVKAAEDLIAQANALVHQKP